MYQIVVVDRSAESRSKMVQAIERILRQGAEEFHFIPRVSLKSLAIEEIKFHGAPDVCIVGEEVVEHDCSDVQKIRETYASSTLLVRLPASDTSLSSIERIARLGADDVLTEEISSRAFLQKLILLSQKKAKPHNGRLILVTGGKGGAGITSVSAALAESALDAGKKVVLVDFDYETQDLSRFLQARPYLNENLQLLLDETALVTEESVRAALVQVWVDEPNLLLMPPPPESRALHENSSSAVRVLLAAFEQLDALSDCVIVDAGCVGGAILEMLFRVADNVLYVTPNDPAALFASVDRVRRYRQFLGETARLSLLVNESSRDGLSGSLLREEFSSAAGLDESAWLPLQLPYCREARRWPGAGSSMATLGSLRLRQALQEVLIQLEIIEQDRSDAATASGALGGIFSAVKRLPRLFVGREKRADNGVEPKLLEHKQEKEEVATGIRQKALLGDGPVIQLEACAMVSAPGAAVPLQVQMEPHKTEPAATEPEQNKRGSKNKLISGVTIS